MFKSKEPPGPRGHFLLGSLKERQEDALRLFESAQNYGPLTRFRFGPIKVLLLNDPDGIHYVLQENSKNYIKGKGYDKLSLVLGKGLLTNDGESWRRQRKLAQPAFHRQRVQEFSKTMSSVTEDTILKWQARSHKDVPVEILGEMLQIAYRIVSNTLFTTQLDEDITTVRTCLEHLATEADALVTRPFSLPYYIPTARNRRTRAAIEGMNGVVYKIIEQRRKNPTSHSDLLSMLLAAQDEESGEGMTDQQLRDEILTIFAAGHETTAMALAWTLYLLSENPEIELKLFSELDSVLGNRTLTFEEISKLPLLSGVINESLRLYPPAWAFARESLGADNICGYPVKKGQLIVISPWVLHRTEEYWPNPQKFDPSRFFVERGMERHKFAYIPFGAGARQCIGNSLALMEMHIILARLLQNFHFRLVPGQVVVPNPLITLRPKSGLPMILEPRAH